MSATAAAPSQPVLIATKLHVPEVRPGTVSREALVRRLVEGGDRKLALVCAPPGWGKTILLSEWHASEAESRSFAWLSLDRSDDDPVRFWSYVIGALRTVEPELGDQALATMPSAGPGLVDSVLPSLLNELATMPRRLVLVLEDYHLVRNEVIHASLAFLIRHLPGTLQVAIASRADPPLPLGSLRAEDEVTEIRAAELRFSAAEADALLNSSLGLGLDAADVELLQARTEGWAAGLRLAALSLQAHEDKHAFVEAFAGDDRQIGDYLHEVLAEQPNGLREFLLRTSILERMCAPLCDAVTGRGDGTEQLAAVERSNLFLVALDTRGHWYRYHHLFRDLLRHELIRSEPRLTKELHRRAAAWHRDEGDVDEAIAHATAANDFGDAGELIACHWRETCSRGEIETVVRWIDALPRSAARADTRLCVARAWSALFLGRLGEASTWRREWGLGEEPASGEGGETASPEFAAVAFDAAFASRLGDVGRANEAGRLVLASYPDETDHGRAFANINLGETLYYAGELAAAAACLDEAVRRLAAAEPSFLVIHALVQAHGYLAAVRADLGEIDEAERSAAEGERLIEGLQQERLPWGALVYVARAKLLELRGDFPAAETAFARAEVLARGFGWPLELAHTLLLLARLKRRRRAYSEARSLAREARQVLATCPDPGVLRDLLAATEHSLQLTPTRRAESLLPADLELSERELTVLRLLASELSQREIGAELYVSFNTVKAHTRSIFRKLGVSTRADAVARGRELGLL